MIDFAIVAQEDIFHTSLAAVVDCFTLIRERSKRVLLDEEPRRGDLLNLTILSPDGRDVRMLGGSPLRVSRAPLDGECFNFVWLPTFRAAGEAEMRRRLADHKPLTNWIATQAEQGAIIAASGAATFFLLEAGLTRTLRIPVSPALLPLARSIFPRLLHDDRTHADFGQLAISSGSGSDLELIVGILARLLSPQSARWLRSVLGVAAPCDGAAPEDALVAAARLRIEQRFADGLSIAALAAELSTSHATLTRRFRKSTGMSPQTYVHTVRMEAARRTLMTTTRSIESIARLVGYSDPRVFRDMFRRHTGVTPRQWRANRPT